MKACTVIAFAIALAGCGGGDESVGPSATARCGTPSGLYRVRWVPKSGSCMAGLDTIIDMSLPENAPGAAPAACQVDFSAATDGCKHTTTTVCPEPRGKTIKVITWDPGTMNGSGVIETRSAICYGLFEATYTKL